MPQTLAVAKPILEQKLKMALFKGASKAINKLINKGATGGPDVSIDGLMFAEKFSATAAPDIAAAIYDFVKEIGIILSNPATLISTSIMSPSPVTGTVPITGFTVV